MQTNTLKSDSLLLVAAFFWGTTFVAQRKGMDHMGPMLYNALRFLLGAVTLAPLIAWPGLRLAGARTGTPRLLFWGGLLAGVALFGGASLQQMGLQYTTALNVSVMNSLGPVLIAGAAAILFRDRLAPIQMAGIAVSFAGVLVVVTRGDPNVLAHLSFNVGDLIIMGSYGLSPVVEIVLGSTVDQVLRESSLPVLICR